MKKYEVTYHLTNGEIKKVIYKNIKVSKQEFLIQMCRGNNNAFTFFADESIENVVNINYVCFLEVKEVK
jgi:hypothetical protein|nr:MAG TPA: hypothetical protein [Caudoviricetes sp.]